MTTRFISPSAAMSRVLWWLIRFDASIWQSSLHPNHVYLSTGTFARPVNVRTFTALHKRGLIVLEPGPFDGTCTFAIRKWVLSGRL